MNDGDAADLVMFITGGPGPGELGTDRQYGRVRDFFTRSKDEVSAELDTLVTQMHDLVQRLAVRMQSFELNEVRFELGFSAEGHLGFIAKAGAHGSVHVTFARATVLQAGQQPGELDPGSQQGDHQEPAGQIPRGQVYDG